MTPRAARIAREYWVGHVYWIELVPGYVYSRSKSHHIARLSKDEAHKALEGVCRCACATCTILLRPKGAAA